MVLLVTFLEKCREQGVFFVNISYIDKLSFFR